MAFQKKGAPSAKSLDFPASDPRSGSCNTNSQGQVIDKQGKVMNWPYQGFTTDNELDPKLNQFPAPQLSSNPQAYKDTTGGVRVGAKGSTTIG